VDKKTTLKEIAKDAGFSVTITSRVLGNYGSFSEATKKAVLESAEKLNYQPNLIARSMRSGSTKAIGVMVNSVLENFWMTLFRGIEQSAIKEGYQVILCDSGGGNPDKERKNLELLSERNVDGVILSPSFGAHKMLKSLSRSGLPVVLIDTEIKGIDVPAVTVDNRGGACEAVEYLIKLGHRRIGIVTGGNEGNTSAERLSGYRDAHKRQGLPMIDKMIKAGNFREEDSCRAVNDFLEMENRPTALFVCNECMTAGALMSIREHKLSIPEDISIVGWDNPGWTSFINPSLTVVDQASHTMGVFAWQALYSKIEKDSDSGRDKNIILKPELIIRESCRALNV
jgi:DNA-binding LacI/PurR family transcriptional regulator